MPVPAQGGDAAGEFVVGFAGQYRVDHKGFEARIPQASGFRGTSVDISSGKGDFARIQENCFPQRFTAVGHAGLNNLDGHPYELKCLLEAHRSKKFPGRRTKDIGGNPRG